MEDSIAIGQEKFEETIVKVTNGTDPDNPEMSFYGLSKIVDFFANRTAGFDAMVADIDAETVALHVAGQTLLDDLTVIKDSSNLTDVINAANTNGGSFADINTMRQDLDFDLDALPGTASGN